MIRLLINNEPYPEQWVNWNEETKTIARSETYHGVIITKTINIEVIEDAYQKIKSIDDANDLAGELEVKTQIFDNIKGWQDDFIGFVDFETVRYSTDMTMVENNSSKTPVNKVSFSAYSSNFANKLIERQDIKIPYDRLETLDGATITPFANEYYSVNIEGIDVVSTNIGTILPAPSISTNVTFPGISHNSSLVGWISTIFNTAGGIGAGFTAPNNEWVEDRMFWNNPKLTGTIKGTIRITYTAAPSGATQSLRILDYKTLTPILGANTNDFYGSSARTVELPFEQEVDGDSRLVIYFGSSGGITSILESECDFTVISIANSSPCNLVPPFEMGTRILEGITGQSNALDTPFFGRTDSPTTYTEDGEGSLFFHTNGRLIRQFPIGYQTTDSDKKSQLTNSFLSWFNSLDKIFCIGAGVKYEDGQYKVYVDDRKEYYKSEVSISFSKDEIELDTYSVEKDMSLYYNKITVGSTYEKPEEAGGLEEYNAKQMYSSPVPNDNDYDLANDDIYAAYPFEFARRLPYDAEETTDYKYDDNNFIFNVERSEGVFQQLSDTDFEEINGLENLTSYINLNITPKRNLLRHSWYLNAGFKGYQSGKLVYNESDKVVTDLSTRKVGEASAIVENEDVLISNLESPRFTGKKITFTARISSDKFNSLVNNPYGLIEYPDLVNGGTGYGYIPRGGEISTNLVDKTTNVELWETKGFSEEGNSILLQDGNYILQESGDRFLLED